MALWPARRRRAHLGLLLALAARVTVAAPVAVLLTAARGERLRGLRGERLLGSEGVRVGAEDGVRLERIDHVEVPHLNVRREGAHRREVTAGTARPLLRREVEPLQAQRVDGERDIVVRVEVVVRLLVHVRLQVAQMLVRARPKQQEVGGTEHKVVRL